MQSTTCTCACISPLSAPPYTPLFIWAPPYLSIYDQHHNSSLSLHIFFTSSIHAVEPHKHAWKRWSTGTDSSCSVSLLLNGLATVGVFYTSWRTLPQRCVLPPGRSTAVRDEDARFRCKRSISAFCWKKCSWDCVNITFAMIMLTSYRMTSIKFWGGLRARLHSRAGWDVSIHA